jgi:hypothetical protein
MIRSVDTTMRNRGTAACVPLAILAVAVVACAQPEQHGDAPAPIQGVAAPNPLRNVYFVETRAQADGSFDVASPDFFDRMERHFRDTYKRGLLVQAREGSNPHRFGMVGGADHPYLGAGGFDDPAPPESENGEPDDRSVPPPRSAASAGALAGVWAEEATLESIRSAMQRSETFATSGTRIQLRFFGGWHYDDDLVDQDRWVARAYERGVPMGGDLTAAPRDRAPSFVVWAVRDPNSAPLERLQIVKGWIEDGAAREETYDVACSDGGEPETTTGRCPDNGAAVDLSDCSFSKDRGDAELSAVWTDPAFNASRFAFYYVRVLENPTCHRSTRDAIRRGVDPPADVPRTIQARALSSPIWYTPVEASR